jgi:hypothetical protein
LVEWSNIDRSCLLETANAEMRRPHRQGEADSVCKITCGRPWQTVLKRGSLPCGPQVPALVVRAMVSSVKAGIHLHQLAMTGLSTAAHINEHFTRWGRQALSLLCNITCKATSPARFLGRPQNSVGSPLLSMVPGHSHSFRGPNPTSEFDH